MHHLQAMKMHFFFFCTFKDANLADKRKTWRKIFLNVQLCGVHGAFFQVSSCVTCHVSHVKCEVSHVMCHMSHVTCHIFYFNFFSGQSSEASRWRVCYQRGLNLLDFSSSIFQTGTGDLPALMNLLIAPGFV